MRNNIYNKTPTYLLNSNYLPFQPNTTTLDIISKFKNQLELGRNQGLQLYETKPTEQVFVKEEKQIKQLDTYINDFKDISK